LRRKTIIFGWYSGRIGEQLEKTIKLCQKKEMLLNSFSILNSSCSKPFPIHFKIWRGKTVAVSPGSSVNFSWSFSGGSDGVLGILWGLKKDGGNAFINNRVLVSLKPSRSPAFFPIALSKDTKNV